MTSEALNQELNFTDNLQVQLKAAGFEATERQLEQFTDYYELLIETNKHLNLTAITDPHEVAVKHMVDSLTALSPVFTEGASLLDLGTGAGFPGIPLAIWRPDLKITLFDSLQKRLTFLQGVIETLGLKNVATLHGRAEDMAHTEAHREAYDIVTSRAVARLPILLEWSLPYVKVGGYLVALKGAIYDEEVKSSDFALQTLGGKIEDIKMATLPTLDDKRAIIYVKKVKPCTKKYPRKPKDIKTKPLEK
ncbi:MAG: 16S rRNA (guanine(527)-N(7))-methyltransferase RsmG [Veillonella sp.]|uniref:16S rRNA (guanine(527)-N(7))-methyltransferase RsmG n=1 Tax=Veillonella sp. TaxID=1926307 RepID=UPI0025E1F44D|nr:16S rRNA (guanine(527)-N(7))-methyltransferase RsmG [Veillonella sp.]MBS4913181.1 16S rRNA (guanine(527)-N(7))-methyltransferase RsmG [Veillonella sp.]